MTSPRFGESGLHLRKDTFASIVALAALLIAPLCAAQSTQAAPAADPDSAVVLPADSVGTDSVGTDSVGTDSTAAPAPPAPPPIPVDSALGTACEGTAGNPPDLLLVTFRPSTTASERSAVAREVGGTLLGLSEHDAPGSWYLRVPGSAGDRAVADRLIRLSPVLEVGTTRCRR